MNSSNAFVESIKLYSGVNVFNPYVDVCSVYDKFNANKIREKNLTAILSRAESIGVDSIWIGRDLGHKGGRRTGLALTDETHLDGLAERWGVDLVRATKGSAVYERTAGAIWDVLSETDENVFMWNVFPFHPHPKDNSFSNRAHTAKERAVGEKMLQDLVGILKPRRIVAIGNDAHKSALKIFDESRVFKVRHPSYGGEKDFIAQMSKIYSLNNIKLL